MQQTYWYIPLTALLLLVIVVITQTNLSLFTFLNTYCQFLGEIFWANTTMLGDTLIVCCLLLPILYRQWTLFKAALIGGLLTTIIVHGMKHGLGVLRPSITLPSDQIHIIGTALTSSPAFPSGHTATATFFAALIALHWQRWSITLLACSFAITVAISRIAVGVHWPTDVLAGVIVGWSCAIAGIYAARYWQWQISHTAKYIINSLILCCTLALLLIYNSHYPHTRYLEFTIAILGFILSVQNLIQKKPSSH